MSFMPHFNKEFEHRWCIPFAHAILWMLGIMVTTDFLGLVTKLLASYDNIAISLAAVVLIFLAEIALTFFDIVFENQTKAINITLGYYLGVLILVIIAIVVFMFLTFYHRGNMTCIGFLILVSAVAKGMEIWLQNNWDKFKIDFPKGNPQLSFVNK